MRGWQVLGGTGCLKTTFNMQFLQLEWRQNDRLPIIGYLTELLHAFLPTSSQFHQATQCESCRLRKIMCYTTLYPLFAYTFKTTSHEPMPLSKTFNCHIYSFGNLKAFYADSLSLQTRQLCSHRQSKLVGIKTRYR
jgi:hypothetical protein